MSKFGGNKYLNIWKMTREEHRIKIEPSINASESGCFHTGNPAYFQIVDQTLDQLLDKF